MSTEVFVILGVVLIVAALFLKRPRTRQVAVAAGIISLVVATVLDPDILVTFADKVSTVLDGHAPE
jgi:uncharacterized membrane protein HdeD (DUF308 family)